MEEHKRSALAKAAMFGAALIWGVSFVVVKNTVDVIPPNLLIAMRFTIGALILCVVFYKRLKNLNKSYFIAGGIIGTIVFVAFCIQTIGIQYTTPGKNAFLTAIYCVIVPFLFWLVSKKRPDAYNFAAAFICIAGIGFVCLQGDLSIGIGDTLTLVGGAFFAGQIVAISIFAKDKDPILLTIVQFATTAVLAWIAALLFEAFPESIALDTVGGILFLAVFSTTIGLLMQNIGQKYVSASASSIILSLEAVFGVLFSVILYHEELTWRLILGFALIFFAVLISETKLSFFRRKKDPNTYDV